MNHLIVCREFPPAPHSPGGIGTYTTHIARLLAEAGETVHVIAQGWHGAPPGISESCGGRLIVHRLPLDQPLAGYEGATESRILKGLLQSDCPSQTFSWQTARLAERLVEEEGIDLLEGPEWEASLYYLQLRRALGLGPSRQPPCLIHLHSPAEFIIRSNEWNETLADLIAMQRFEEFTIRAADALLCPSRYLARGAAQRFGLNDDQIAVIPYPLGDSPPIERSAAAWASNRICYVGRLELRKGVVEWIDAAVEVARTDPRVEFDLIGSDTSLDGPPGSSVRAKLDQRIPDDLRGRFHFQPSRSRTELRQFLSETSVAVVPSRWDNLPYTCIEAMGSGLPVLVSPNGGMAELVQDGESGWVSADGSSAALAVALRRVLDTPAERRAKMGRNAEAAARRICGNEVVLARQMELRSRVACVAARRSIPGNSERRPAATRAGMGVVVTCLERPELLADCLAAVGGQASAAVDVVVAANATSDLPDWCRMVKAAGSSREAARAKAVRILLDEAPNLLGVTFVNEAVRLDPTYLRQLEAVLQSQPQVGMISSFLQYGKPWNELDATPLPVCYTGDPLADEAPCLTVRTEALFSTSGWSAVTCPEVLASAAGVPPGGVKRHSAMALSQGGSPKLALQWFQSATMGERVGAVLQIFKQPRRIAQWATWLLRAAVNKAR